MNRPATCTPSPEPQTGWIATRHWSPVSRTCSRAPCLTPATLSWARHAAPGRIRRCALTSCPCDATRDLLVAGDVPRQRGTGGQHLRLETVGGHRGRGDEVRAAGVLVRRSDAAGVDGRLGAQVSRRPRPVRFTAHPREGRERAERAAAPAGRLLQRRSVVEARSVVPAVRPRGSRGARTSPTGTP